MGRKRLSKQEIERTLQSKGMLSYCIGLFEDVLKAERLIAMRKAKLDSAISFVPEQYMKEYVARTEKLTDLYEDRLEAKGLL